MEGVNFNQTEPAILFKEMQKAIDENLESSHDWEKFKLHFENVHPKFFERLSKQVPNITVNDLKNCAYIKMNLSVKEVAVLMNITPKSAKMNRYRLKKKLSLGEDDSLLRFIQNF
jgi:DNA-binding CsgD family transcriptional regulator